MEASAHPKKNLRFSFSIYLGVSHQGWDNSSSGIYIPSSCLTPGSHKARITLDSRCSVGTVVKFTQLGSASVARAEHTASTAASQQGEEALLISQITEVLSKPFMRKASPNLFSTCFQFSIQADKKSPNELHYS